MLLVLEKLQEKRERLLENLSFLVEVFLVNLLTVLKEILQNLKYLLLRVIPQEALLRQEEIEPLKPFFPYEVK